MNKYIKDFDFNETVKLIKNCNAVKEFLIKKAEATADVYIEEYLHNATWSFCSYDIGAYQHNYFKFSEDYEHIKFIIDYVEELAKDYDFFYTCECYKDFLRVAKQFNNVCYDLWQKDDQTDFRRIEKRYLELLHSINNFICEQLTEEVNYPYKATEEDLADYIDEFTHSHKDAYIIDDDFSQVFEHVPAHVNKIA